MDRIADGACRRHGFRSLTALRPLKRHLTCRVVVSPLDDQARPATVRRRETSRGRTPWNESWNEAPTSRTVRIMPRDSSLRVKCPGQEGARGRIRPCAPASEANGLAPVLVVSIMLVVAWLRPNWSARVGVSPAPDHVRPQWLDGEPATADRLGPWLDDIQVAHQQVTSLGGAAAEGGAGWRRTGGTPIRQGIRSASSIKNELSGSHPDDS